MPVVMDAVKAALRPGSVRAIQKTFTEGTSEAHQILRGYPGHDNTKPDEETVPGIVHPGATGVIYASDRATANGFSMTDPTWANLGQGAPETGDLPGGPPRIRSVSITDDMNEYSATTGAKELRVAVAKYYNEEYRLGKESQYTWENVCITPGGRAGMTRVASVIGPVYTGYQVPEYSSYSEVLSAFKNLIPVPTTLKASDGYKLDLERLKIEAAEMSLGVVVCSNPRNPTGQCVEGEELKELVGMSRESTTIILDEFYSWYQYPEDQKDLGMSLSGAQYVEDVDQDNVVLINGLTKGWRLPGWRVAWVVGPKALISAISQSGSFLDGGASHPLQMAAVPLLAHDRVQQEKISLQKAFRIKRDYCLDRLAKMGLPVTLPPKATFYIWLNLEGLKEPINNGLAFFEELLKEKVIVVPGIFFDINPSKRRDLFKSPCHHFVRISFGPAMDQLVRGMDGIERVLAKHGHTAHNTDKQRESTADQNAEAGPSDYANQLLRPAAQVVANGASHMVDAAKLVFGTVQKKLHGYEFYRSIGSPKYVIAPMVDQSELAWRVFSRSPVPDTYIRSYRASQAASGPEGAASSSATDSTSPHDKLATTEEHESRAYPIGGAHLCYTQMINAGLFAYGGQKAKFSEQMFDFSFGEEGSPKSLAGLQVSDRPLIVQFAANDPQVLLEAAKKVEERCDAVDLNFGCPQHIAKRGRYGSFLQDEWDLIYSLINILHVNLKVPVTAKFRVFPDVEKTVRYAQMMEKAGASIITCHGRTREMKGQMTGLADWQQIRAVKQAVKIPVFANGNILYREDVDECLRVTGCDGVMTAEGNLSHPTLFVPAVSPFSHPPIYVLADHYLDIVERLQTHTNNSAQKAHLFRILKPALDRYVDLRNRMAASSHGGTKVFRDIVREVRERSEAERKKSSGALDVGKFPIGRDGRGIKEVPFWASQPYVRALTTPVGADGFAAATSSGGGDAIADLASGGTGEERVIAGGDVTSTSEMFKPRALQCRIPGCGGMAAGSCTRSACSVHCRSIGAVESSESAITQLAQAVKEATGGGLVGFGCESHEEKDRARRERRADKNKLRAGNRKRGRGEEGGGEKDAPHKKMKSSE